MKRCFTIVVAIILLAGCKKNISQSKIDYAFLGGKIINANNNFVVLSKSDRIIDTIFLDGNSRFLYKIDNLEQGLYSFSHGGEIQMVLLEPSDSIIFRLNTFDFDESLVYTGEGAKKNNYLMNAFLENENEEKRIFKLCQLDAYAYEKQVDSLKTGKLERLKTFKSNHVTSDLFDKIAAADINYTYYFQKEIYPFIHYGNNKSEILESLPKDFYSYRKDINYNDDFLKDYFNYHSFLRSSFNNLALSEHINHTNNHEFDRGSLCYNLDRLRLIDSLVTNTSIKDNLLYRYTINYISNSNDIKNNDVVLKLFLDKSSDTEEKEKISQYVNSINNLKIDGNLPNVTLIDYKNTETTFNALINSPTVICFWSHKFYEHFKKGHYKINDLKTKYPEVKFISINIDNYGIPTGEKTLKRNQFSCNNEYQFKNPKNSLEKLAVYPLTKTIIIDKNQKIVNAHTNIFAVNFEEQLLGLLNR